MIDGFTRALLATSRDVFAVSALLIGIPATWCCGSPSLTSGAWWERLVFVVAGLAFFLIGTRAGAVPGRRADGAPSCRRPPSCPRRAGGDGGGHRGGGSYTWVYLSSPAVIGFSTTLAEPALIAVAMKAERGVPRHDPAVGAPAGRGRGRGTSESALGTFRIVTGSALSCCSSRLGYLIALVIQTMFAPKEYHCARLRLGRSHHLHRHRSRS